jgi:microcystin-dependent protein
MKSRIAISLLLILLAIPLKNTFAGSDAFAGEITIFAGSYPPKGFAFCNGQLLRIVNYPSLFSVIGDKYGGDGVNTFGLPNLTENEKALNGARYIISTTGDFPPKP